MKTQTFIKCVYALAVTATVLLFNSSCETAHDKRMREDRTYRMSQNSIPYEVANFSIDFITINDTLVVSKEDVRMIYKLNRDDNRYYPCE